MEWKLIYAIILTVMPVTELRVGLPLAISYALEKNISIPLIFSFIIFLNVLVIFLIFYFLDHLHVAFMNFKFYKKFFKMYTERVQKKASRFEKKYQKYGFIALVLFVAIPLPGTGAWTGSFISWALNLNRKKSIAAISLGVLIAGLFTLLGTFGFLHVFNF